MCLANGYDWCSWRLILPLPRICMALFWTGKTGSGEGGRRAPNISGRGSCGGGSGWTLAAGPIKCK